MTPLSISTSPTRAKSIFNPKVRILFITPTYTWYPDMGLTCEELDNGGGLLEEYVEAQMELGEELGIETVDLYSVIPPHNFLPPPCPGADIRH